MERVQSCNANVGPFHLRVLEKLLSHHAFGIWCSCFCFRFACSVFIFIDAVVFFLLAAYTKFLPVFVCEIHFFFQSETLWLPNTELWKLQTTQANAIAMCTSLPLFLACGEQTHFSALVSPPRK